MDCFYLVRVLAQKVVLLGVVSQICSPVNATDYYVIVAGRHGGVSLLIMVWFVVIAIEFMYDITDIATM